MTEPVTPPTAVVQWSHADVARAKSLGRHDLIAQAHAAGQLDNIIADPGALRQPPAADASQQSRPMGHAEAAAYLAATTKEIQ